MSFKAGSFAHPGTLVPPDLRGRGLGACRNKQTIHVKTRKTTGQNNRFDYPKNFARAQTLSGASVEGDE